MIYNQDNYIDSLRETNNIYQKYSRFISRKNVGLDILPGWLPTLKKMFEAIEASGCQDVVVQQIKEKFGVMRFYYSGGNPELHKILCDLENSARNCCELCGEVGIRSNINGTLVTRCQEHSNTKIDFYSDPRIKMCQTEFLKIQKKFNLDPE